MVSFGLRLSEVFSRYGQLCVGIDPSAEQLESWSLPDSARGAKEFSLAILGACEGKVGIVKPQVAFFEQYGPSGLSVLSDVLLEAKRAGFLVIADAKRGDIGSSMAGYTRGWLSREAVFESDALTLSPYLGLESLRPSIEVALETQKGVFVLSATSNPEARFIQAAMSESKSIASKVAEFVGSFNTSGLGSVGCVVGATVSLSDLGLAEADFKNTPILMPGFGAQGAELSLVGDQFNEIRSNLICNVSRSIAGQSPIGLSERISASSIELSKGLSL